MTINESRVEMSRHTNNTWHAVLSLHVCNFFVLTKINSTKKMRFFDNWTMQQSLSFQEWKQRLSSRKKKNQFFSQAHNKEKEKWYFCTRRKRHHKWKIYRKCRDDERRLRLAFFEAAHRIFSVAKKWLIRSTNAFSLCRVTIDEAQFWERERKRFRFATRVIRKRRDCATNKQELTFKRRFFILQKRMIRFCEFHAKIVVQTKSWWFAYETFQR
jgi:hypothetical protein